MFADRAHGAFLGLALGDAFGRSLEFITGERVRTRPVAIPSGDFMWTDDTHMALYLVDALEAIGARSAGLFPEDAFGRAVGDAFVQWSHDPLTPSTAPGNTCLAGAAAFERSGDWRTSGVRRSDGCGAVMRVVPLPIVWSGAALVTAARVQALVTHAHENAPATAIAACLIVRALLEGASLDAALVTQTVHHLDTLGASTTSVSRALHAAVRQAQRAELTWLDEAAIPDGDGGWRSPSALGLALVAALRWTDDPRLAIEKAARIDGDSDSVACLTGMFLGAVHGVAGLPADWIEALPGRRDVQVAVDRLLALSDVSASLPATPSSHARTSVSDPIEVAWLPTKTGARSGRLGLTFAPGKQASSTLGRPWARTLATDLTRLRDVHGVDVLVSLVEDDELARLQISELVSQAEAAGIAVMRHPVPDGGVPTSAAAAVTLQTALTLARSGRRVVFHCRGGLGRAGTFAALALRLQGRSAEAAMREVRAVRPGAIENRTQERFIEDGLR